MPYIISGRGECDVDVLLRISLAASEHTQGETRAPQFSSVWNIHKVYHAHSTPLIQE